MESKNIVSLLELQKNKEKDAELKFYREKLENLRMRQSFIYAEMDLTIKIIEMIEKEKIIHKIISDKRSNSKTFIFTKPSIY